MNAKYWHLPALVVLFWVFVLLQGCAVLPMNMQPQDSGSKAAEGVWEVIDTVDTVQTAKFVAGGRCHEQDPAARAIYGGGNPSPSRVVATNVILMAAHSSVSAWFDRHVQSAQQYADAHPDEDSNVGPWYVGRIVWHAVSIGASTAAVIQTRRNGCL